MGSDAWLRAAPYQLKTSVYLRFYMTAHRVVERYGGCLPIYYDDLNRMYVCINNFHIILAKLTFI